MPCREQRRSGFWMRLRFAWALHERPMVRLRAVLSPEAPDRGECERLRQSLSIAVPASFLLLGCASPNVFQEWQRKHLWEFALESALWSQAQSLLSTCGGGLRSK